MKKFSLELPNAKNTKPPFMSINLRKVPVQNILNSSGAEILDKSKDQHRAAGHRRRIDVRGGACWDFGDWRRQFSSRETGRGGTLNQPWSTSRYDHHCALQVFLWYWSQVFQCQGLFQNIQWALQTLCFEYFLVDCTVTIVIQFFWLQQCMY